MSTSNQQKLKGNLKKQLEDQTQKAGEYLDTLQRLQAEFENYQKRIEKEQAIFRKYAKEDLILKLLDVLDNFERANIKDEGIKLIEKQIKSIIEQESVTEIKNENFDPNFHEAIIKEKSEKKEGTILEVLQKGYKLHDKVIRASKVKVSGGKE